MIFFTILIGNLFQQIYTLADRIIVGRFVGDTAFSAIGATNALSMMFMSMCMGAAIGTGVVVSQYFGAKDEKGTAASIANGSYTCILIAIVMTLLALVTTKPILLLLNTPQSLLPDALTYMYIYMGGLFGQAFIYRKADRELIRKTMQVGIPTGFHQDIRTSDYEYFCNK